MDIFAGSQRAEKNDMISDDVLNFIKEVIYKKSGIYFTDNRKYLLKNRVLRRIRECNMKSCEEYCRLFKNGSSINRISQEKELSMLLNYITVNETSFFRNEPQLNAFLNNVLFDVIKDNKDLNKKELTVWSAGCSTGEEPYTIALMLHENAISRANIRIIATDINDNALEYARRGRYKDNTLRRVPVPYLQKYFTYDGGTNFVIKDSIKNMVVFKHVNLLDEKELKFFRGFDIVFCRNVIIYFDDIVKKKVIKNIHRSLRTGGYLFIGHSESLHNILDSFQQFNFEKAQAYKKINTN